MNPTAVDTPQALSWNSSGRTLFVDPGPARYSIRAERLRFRLRAKDVGSRLSPGSSRRVLIGSF